MKQVADRDFGAAKIKVIATGDVLDDEQLAGMGDAVLGIINSHNYSAAHDSPENKAFVTAFEKANPSMRPNFMAVGGYDGMALIYKALDKTRGDTDGTKLVEAMKGAVLDEPARPDLDRSADARHHPERLYPQGREEGRRALQRRVRDRAEREGSREGREEVGPDPWRRVPLPGSLREPLSPQGGGMAAARVWMQNKQ